MYTRTSSRRNEDVVWAVFGKPVATGTYLKKKKIEKITDVAALRKLHTVTSHVRNLREGILEENLPR